MKITQEELTFKPVTLTFGTREEVEALRDIVDSIGSEKEAPSKVAWKLIVEISDAFTNCTINY